MFQSDLLTTVVIANDIKTEAQEQTEQMLAENQFLRDRNEALHDELRGVQGELQNIQREKEQVSGIRGRVINTVDRELQNLRLGREHLRESGAGGGGAGGKNISVKQLIHSIEEQVKNPAPVSPTAASPLSPTIPIIQNTQRRNSTDSVNSIKSSSERSSESPDARRPGGDAPYKSLLRNKDSSKESRSSLAHR